MTEWTEQHIIRLREMNLDNFSAAQIAVSLNSEFRASYSRNAVIGKRSRLGLAVARAPRVAAPKPPRDRSAALLRLRSPKTRTPPRPEALVDDDNIPLEQRKTLFELTSETCRWPVGHPGTETFFFCGGPTKEEKPYCSFHCTRAYDKPPPRKIQYPLRRAA